MKEFIDKLIERLEENEEYENDNGNYYAMRAYVYAKEIVNELAEEFDPDINVGTNVSEMPTGWILCSERLPEEDKRVLCQGENYMFIGFVDSFDGEWTDNHHYRRTNVKAWRELPAPYKEGE